MKKLILLFTMMATFMLSFANMEITETQALQLVKNNYSSNTLIHIYIAETDSIFDDGDDSCIFDSIPQQDWLTSKTTPKWLVFVDEDPMKGWCHSCSYYYIPQQYDYTNTNTIPVVRFNGTKYPRYIVMSFVNENLCENLNYSYKSLSFKRDDFWDDYYWDTDVLFMGGGYNKNSNHWRFWNDCNYLYETLQSVYKIHPLTMYSCYAGNSGLLYDNDIITNNGGIFSPIPYYFGYKHNSFTKEGIYEMFDYLSTEVEIYNFVVYISCHGNIDSTTGNPYLALWNIDDYDMPLFGNDLRLYASELDSLLGTINSQTTTIILQNCHSGAFIETLSKPGRVIITACGPDEESSSFPSNDTDAYFYNVFSNYFTHAFHGEDLEGNPVNTDYDNNGMVSMAEAYYYANEHDTLSTEHPMYCSNPLWLGEELTFDILPDTANLFIRDNLQDVGSKIHASTGTYWNSPDIWVRNDDDGFYFKENDHLLVGSDEKLYIYVRVNNRGYRNYVDPSKYLHLYWKENSLNMSKDAIFGTGSPYGGKITTLSLDTAIAVDTSCIYRYVWQLPSTLVSRAASNGSILDIEVLALVNDYTTSVVPDDACGMIALREHSNVAMRKENTILPSLGVYVDGGGMMVYQAKRVVTIPIYVNAVDNNAISKITLISDLSSSGSSFSFCDYYLELSPGIYNLSSNLSRTNITTTNSAPEKYKLNAAGSSFEFKVPQNGVDSLIFYCEYNNRAPASDINHILHLKMTNSSDSIIDVETYTIKIDATGGTGPGIIMLNGNDGSCQLVATDISEPSRIEWFNPQDELIGESDTLCLNASRQQGEYTLRVASEKTGAVAYATAIIHDESAIESISPNPFNGQFTVRLSHPAVANTIIRLSPLSGNGRVAEYPVIVGEREVAVSAENCLSGIYIVSLIENGKLTGGSRIIKN